MLSGECALGKYPVVCVETMDRISKAIEHDINYWKRFNEKCMVNSDEDVEMTIATSSCVTAENTNATAIIAYAEKPEFAFKLASRGAKCPIFVTTTSEKTFHHLGIAWNITPILVKSAENAIEEGIKILKEQELLEENDTVVIAGMKEQDRIVVSSVIKVK